MSINKIDIKNYDWDENDNKCLIIEPNDFHHMEFKEDSTLLVISSIKYDKNGIYMITTVKLL